MSSYLHELSTYGIMKDMDTIRIKKILDFLIEKKYLALDGAEYPVVVFSEKTRAFIRDKPKLTMMMRDIVMSDIGMPGMAISSQVETKSISEKSPASVFLIKKASSQFDEALFTELKKLRSRIAAEAKVPSYIVFSDATLKDMAARSPTTAADFLEVSGVGTIKQERYAYVFTELIRKYKTKNKDQLTGNNE
jgi:ATP-dependent DNA helicase RecQ